MSMTSLALYSCWRDYYGMYNAYIEPQFAPLESSKCHMPRLALAPDVQHMTIPASGKITYNFHLVPGSLIWGLWITPDAFNDNPAIQLTDVSMNHQFFQEPVSAQFLISRQATQLFPSYTLLPTPHPVVGDGLFTLEVWGTPGTLFYLTLGVAEVTDCPVR